MKRTDVRSVAKCLTVSGALAVATIFPGSASAGPTDPSVTASLEAINKEVTYRRPAAKQEEALVTYAAYELRLENFTTNSLNRIYVNATAENIGGTDPVYFDSLAGIAPGAYTCTGFNSSTLSCETNLSVPPGEYASFIVVARAPSDGSQIKITWSAGGHEGNGQGNGCCAITGDPATTTLIDPTSGSFTYNAQSFIKNTGGKLFTGDRWITKANDPITTLVVIPGFSSAAYDLGRIAEEENTGESVMCSAQGHFTKCYASSITLPNVNFKPNGDPPTDFMTIVVRVDSSVSNAGTKIEDVLVKYDDVPVFPCGSTTPEIYPCIVDRRIIRNKNSVENYTSDLKDDLQWTIKHYKNGRYAFF